MVLLFCGGDALECPVASSGHMSCHVTCQCTWAEGARERWRPLGRSTSTAPQTTRGPPYPYHPTTPLHWLLSRDVSQVRHDIVNKS